MDYAALIQMLQAQDAEEPFTSDAYTAGVPPSKTGSIIGGVGKLAGPFGTTLGVISSMLNTIAAMKEAKRRQKEAEEARKAAERLYGAKLLSSAWDTPRYGEGRY